MASAAAQPPPVERPVHGGADGALRPGSTGRARSASRWAWGPEDGEPLQLRPLCAQQIQRRGDCPENTHVGAAGFALVILTGFLAEPHFGRRREVAAVDP